MTNQTYITKTNLADVLVIERPLFTDDRGFFRETYRQQDLDQALSVRFEPLQANHSRSIKHTLRGIHIAPWHKLVSVLRGQVQQVVVDTRPHSPTFGDFFSIILGEDNWRSVFVPAGCGNSFLVLSDIADYHYQASDYWSPGKELGLHYLDQTVGINWQSDQPLLSEVDQNNLKLSELFPKKP